MVEQFSGKKRSVGISSMLNMLDKTNKHSLFNV